MDRVDFSSIRKEFRGHTVTRDAKIWQKKWMKVWKAFGNFYSKRSSDWTPRCCEHRHWRNEQKRLVHGTGRPCIRKLMANISRRRKRSAERRSWASLKAVHKLRSRFALWESWYRARIGRIESNSRYVRVNKFLAITDIIFTSTKIRLRDRRRDKRSCFSSSIIFEDVGTSKFKVHRWFITGP